MPWNKHLDYEGKHSLLSPSSYSWVNYISEEDSLKLFARYQSQYTQLCGTVLHEYAKKRIQYSLKMKNHDKDDVLFYLLDHGIPSNAINIDFIYDNLVHYVNDAIGYRMDPEVVLYYSPNCFGTTDAISFKNNYLRIHDYKSGQTKAGIEQLYIYTALFLLEYKIRPEDINVELRIYQYDGINIKIPTISDIAPIMDKIVTFDKMIDEYKRQGGIVGHVRN